MRIQKFKKHLLIIFFISGFITSGSAQGNLPYVDEKLIHFGFSLGANMMNFDVMAADSARLSSLRPGFSVGIITNLRLNRYLNLRFNPTLHFGERELSYVFKTGNESLIIQSIPICLPVYLKYSAERKDNYRPYLICGGGMWLDLSHDTEKPVLFHTLDFYTEFGVGCDIYFSFFKLAPELKYQIGFNDMVDHTHQAPGKEAYTNILSRLSSRMLTLTFNFE